ncbi:MazG nucleotide pyrophosphohydrolase family protein [Corynebacterium mustelae]|uniref:MazG nucleotide pyrophosphohydrolase family protein n=1 Tax=Corynebacterium mustelae TaxID=571915 RepID=A0A0G3H0S7_9CORY|nr:MazG nucleotide pyrophosphohydrolase domain-containing protein [Corynebacterium mustelae]AKK05428.1 MazG nucleotide pyrophosphohydrolase family protein [Corynebacterium mustelae]
MTATNTDTITQILVIDSRWPGWLAPHEMTMVVHAHRAEVLYFAAAVSADVQGDLLAAVTKAADSGLLPGHTEPAAPGGLLVATTISDPEVHAALSLNIPMAIVPSVCDATAQAVATMQRALDIGEWERKQTHESLIPHLIEETAELVDAINTFSQTEGADRQQAAEELRAELGDVLLQVLFHAEIASRRGDFDFSDVAGSFVEKLRARSPYLFDGTASIVPAKEQERLWYLGKAKK